MPYFHCTTILSTLTHGCRLLDADKGHWGFIRQYRLHLRSYRHAADVLYVEQDAAGQHNTCVPFTSGARSHRYTCTTVKTNITKSFVWMLCDSQQARKQAKEGAEVQGRRCRTLRCYCIVLSHAPPTHHHMSPPHNCTRTRARTGARTRALAALLL